PDMRGFEWFYLWNELNPQLVARIGHRLYNATTMAFSPSEQVVAIGGNVLNDDGKSVRVVIDFWNYHTRSFLRRIEPPGSAHIWALNFSHDGQSIAGGLCKLHPRCSVAVFDVASGEMISEHETERINTR